MGRIFISAGHGGIESSGYDPGFIVGGISEAQEMIQLRNVIASELQSLEVEVLSVPDLLSASESIQWINERTRPGDVALEIHAAASKNLASRGAAVFYIAMNQERWNHAKILLSAIGTSVPPLLNPDRGVKPDTTIAPRGLSFCRLVSLPSLLLEVGFLTNPEERLLIQNQRAKLAQGIANGLVEWSRTVSGLKLSYPSIQIKANNVLYRQNGILVNGNSYIPLELVEELGVNPIEIPQIQRTLYNSVMYARAVDLRGLRDYKISVGWDNDSRAVILRSLGKINQILSKGRTTAEQLFNFLKANNNNQETLTQFSDLPQLYINEALSEGVNYDIAFCQMCIETNFLRFSGDIRPSQNNFGGLADTGGSVSATFTSARLGVRAHIQLLKFYASKEPEPFKYEVVAPRIKDPQKREVTPGIAPDVQLLSKRWSRDPQYATTFLDLIGRLYESANLV